MLKIDGNKETPWLLHLLHIISNGNWSLKINVLKSSLLGFFSYLVRWDGKERDTFAFRIKITFTFVILSSILTQS